MNLFEKLDEIFEQEDKILPKGATKVKTEFSFDENMFNKLANFIINLDPDSLTDGQLEEVLDIIDSLEVDIDEIDELVKYANKTKLSKNQYSKKWYSKNKNEIKKRKERFEKSSQGRKRDRVEDIKSKQNKTATGRTKLKYNRRVRSDR